MQRRRITGFPLAAIALVVGIVLPLVGCSSDDSSDSPTTSPASVDATGTTAAPTDLGGTTTTTIGPVRLGIRTTPLGDIVVDADGMTLYAKATTPFDGCTAACLDAWPPVRATSVSVGAGLEPTLAVVVPAAGAAPAETTEPTDPTATTIVTEGTVTYAGQPLSRFVGDVLPGDTTGQGFNQIYFVVLADGTLVRPPESTTTTTAP